MEASIQYKDEHVNIKRKKITFKNIFSEKILHRLLKIEYNVYVI